jgi:hypothetical protein
MRVGIAFSPVNILTDEAVHTLMGEDEHRLLHDQLNNHDNVSASYQSYETSCVITMPIYKALNGFDEPTILASAIGGFIYAIIDWDSYLSDLGQNELFGIDIVLYNTCGQELTYAVTGNYVRFVGVGDLHTTEFNDHVRWVNITANVTNIMNTDVDDILEVSLPGHCLYYVGIYPSAVFMDLHQSNLPTILSVTYAAVFVCIIIAFVLYDCNVQARNDKLIGAAVRSTAIVSSLFPTNVRDRLLAEKEIEEDALNLSKKTNTKFSNLRAFLNKERGTAEDSDDDDSDDSESDDDSIDISNIYKSKPIADLFPETTILFGDIVGFTAWSSGKSLLL